MAEGFSNEGLDLLLGIVPKNGANLASMYLGMFTGETAATVPASTCVLRTYTSVTEVAYTSYARAQVLASAWGSPGSQTVWSQSARAVVAPQTSFAAAGGAYAGPAINGFFVCDLLGHGSETGIFYSNFVEGAIASLALGDVVKITPTFGMLP